MMIRIRGRGPLSRSRALARRYFCRWWGRLDRPMAAGDGGAGRCAACGQARRIFDRHRGEPAHRRGRYRPVGPARGGGFGGMPSRRRNPDRS